MNQLDEGNGVPLYYQLKELIREKINNSVWKEGDKIPNEMDIAEEYNVSRSTVRQAILALVNEGILHRKQGKGTFVAQAKVEGDFINFFYPLKFGDKHILLSIKEISTPPLSIQKKLQLEDGQPVFELIRTRLFNKEPVAIEKTFLASKIAPDLKNENLERRLYDILKEKYNIQIAKSENYIEPVILDEFEAKHLQVKDLIPSLKITRLAKTADDTPVILINSIIRGDRCRLFLKSE